MSDGEADEADRSDAASAAGEAAGEVVGRGLGGLIVLAVSLAVLGPLLWVPLFAAVRAWTTLDVEAPARPLAALAAFGATAMLLGLLMLQRNPVVRTGTVFAAALAWAVVVWLSDGRVWNALSGLPAWREPGTAGWIVIAGLTLLYAGLYLAILNRMDGRRWVKRLQGRTRARAASGTSPPRRRRRSR